MPQRADGGFRLSGGKTRHDDSTSAWVLDGAGYDPAAGDAFASNADGTLTVIHQDSPDQYHVSQTVTRRRS